MSHLQEMPSSRGVGWGGGGVVVFPSGPGRVRCGAMLSWRGAVLSWRCVSGCLYRLRERLVQRCLI